MPYTTREAMCPQAGLPRVPCGALTLYCPRAGGLPQVRRRPRPRQHDVVRGRRPRLHVRQGHAHVQEGA
eukprot:scaffold123809_cov30-Phaeocystis_antarctica.AAC.1